MSDRISERASSDVAIEPSIVTDMDPVVLVPVLQSKFGAERTLNLNKGCPELVARFSPEHRFRNNILVIVAGE